MIKARKPGEILTLEDVPLVCFPIEALVFLTESLCLKLSFDQKVSEVDCEATEILGTPFPSDDDKGSTGEARTENTLRGERGRKLDQPYL